RRHTRSRRDWMSDVCSSDLSPVTGPIRINHDESDTIIRQVSEVFTGAGDTTPHAETPGIDPAVNQAVAAHDEEDIGVGRSGNEEIGRGSGRGGGETGGEPGP